MENKSTGSGDIHCGYTHYRYLIINIKDGSKKTIVVKTGSTPKLPSGYTISSCIGGMVINKKREAVK